MITTLAPVRRVLVRLPNWLGDALMARPLLHALRGSHPAARIEAIGPSPILSLLEREGCWDAGSAWPATGRIAPHADAALVLPPSFSSAWRAWRWGARHRIGFATDGRAALLTHPWHRPARGEMHLSREYLAMAAPLGLAGSPLPALAPHAEERRDARALLASTGEVPARWIVLGPGAAYGPAKRWPEVRFAALARQLAARGLSVLVCGGEGDREIATRVAGASGARLLAGLTSPGVQLALCADAVATVSNDSGLAHLAAATGAPTVVVFGSTSSAWTAPLGAAVRVVQHAPVCAPCFQRECRIGTHCLEAVSVDEVARCVAA